MPLFLIQANRDSPGCPIRVELMRKFALWGSRQSAVRFTGQGKRIAVDLSRLIVLQALHDKMAFTPRASNVDLSFGALLLLSDGRPRGRHRVQERITLSADERADGSLAVRSERTE